MLTPLTELKRESSVPPQQDSSADHIRLVVLNMVGLLLSDYTVDEMRAWNFNQVLYHISNYLQSPKFLSKVYQAQIKF
jgi:hypothetical protein